MNDSRVVNRQTDETGPPAMPDGRPVAGSSDIIEPLAARLAEQPLDRAATFRMLMDTALDDAYRRAAVLLGDRFEAEDAVHDAAVKAWQRLGDLRDPGRFEAWFARILVNTCRDRLRRRRRLQRIEVGGDEIPRDRAVAGGRLDAAEDADRLRGALATLSVDERIVVVLRFEADLTVPSIATLTGVPEGTVKSRLHLALRKLRGSLGEAGR
jgi:RNA polymerase sigma-70 factor (ECF subfamily)